MLELLPRIERECAERDVFGVTSNEALHLHATDDAAELAPVIVRAITDNEVRVAYRLPSAEAPWPDALVQGTATSPEAAAHDRIACSAPLEGSGLRRVGATPAGSSHGPAVGAVIVPVRFAATAPQPPPHASCKLHEQLLDSGVALPSSALPRRAAPPDGRCQRLASFPTVAVRVDVL
jgi:hypothetical protein